MENIAIIGFGHVGKSMKVLFPDALVYDPNYEEYKNTQSQINSTCTLAVICVWTGQNQDGSCDTSIVESSIKWLKTPLILIKSTVEPGTTDRFAKKYKKAICMSPEYFGEFNYWVPQEWTIKGWPYMIVGGERADTTKVLDYFVPVLGPNKKYYQCSAVEAELIKYMENAYLATKVTFVNEMYEITKTFDANWYKVWEGWVLDPRVERSHTAVFPKKRGFGGKCLSKDIIALVRSAEKNNYSPKFLKEVLKSNIRFKNVNK